MSWKARRICRPECSDADMLCKEQTLQMINYSVVDIWHNYDHFQTLLIKVCFSYILKSDFLHSAVQKALLTDWIWIIHENFYRRKYTIHPSLTPTISIIRIWWELYSTVGLLCRNVVSFDGLTIMPFGAPF